MSEERVNGVPYNTARLSAAQSALISVVSFCLGSTALVAIVIAVLLAYCLPGSIYLNARNVPTYGQRLVNHFWPGTTKQESNTGKTLVNIPGGQFLPSLNHPLNILVMGVDSNGKNTQRFAATRSDTMMLVSVDPQKEKIGIISIPRDSRVAIPNRHGEDKINVAHALGGPQMAIETVKQAFNVPIDKYLVVDTEGFRRILEILGPIDVIVEKKMSYVDHTASLNINLEPGLTKLDAKQAEGYIRYRHDLRGDIGRIERQQWFARQLASKLASPQSITKLPALLKIASDCTVTDLNVDEMVRLVGFGCHLSPKQIEMATLPGIPGMSKGISYWLPDPLAASAIFKKLINCDKRSTAGNESINESPLPDNEFALAQGSAMAFAPPVNDLTPVEIPSSYNRPWTAIIRYPKGCEEQVGYLEFLLNRAGFVIKNKYRADLSECQHEEIVENSTHALSLDTDALRAKLPCLSNWPSVISIDSQPGADLVFVITPSSKFSS